MRLHKNLGHPAPETLARHLTIAKASPHVIQGAKEFVCDACVESTQPRHQRPAKLHEPQEFNDTVGLDGFFWRGQAGFQVHVVHLIDEGSCFHIGRRVESRHHQNAIQVVQEAWASWAGYLKHMYLDPAGELRSNALKSTLQAWNTTCFITSEAWQRGRIERHGHVVKQMLSRIDGQKPISDLQEFDQVLLHCFQAKNALIRRNGYSPEQIVLGKSPRLPASLCSDDQAAAHALASADSLEGEVFRKSLERRSQARQAFIEADNDEAMRRALLRRSNPSRGPLLPGMWMLYWIKRTNPNRAAAGKWHGPAKIISVEGSSVVYLSHGTKTIKAPPEFLRPASLREWHQATTDALLPGPGTAPVGGSSNVLDLSGMVPPNREPSSSAYPNLVSNDLPAPARAAPARPIPADGPEVSVISGDDEINQPEQELTPQVSAAPGTSEGPPSLSPVPPATEGKMSRCQIQLKKISVPD